MQLAGNCASSYFNETHILRMLLRFIARNWPGCYSEVILHFTSFRLSDPHIAEHFWAVFRPDHWSYSAGSSVFYFMRLHVDEEGV